MKEKRWSKAGRELKKSNPSLFTGGSGNTGHRFKGGAHGRDIDYKRSDKRTEERNARRGEWED